MNLRALPFLFGLAVIVILTCADAGDPPTGGDNGDNGDTITAPTFTEVNEIFVQSCGTNNVVCHQDQALLSSFFMHEYTSIVTHVADTGKTVVPGFADSSNLYLKTFAPPPFGDKMPITGPELTTDEQNLIRDWINDGAQDN